MCNIYNIFDKMQFIEEVATLEYEEWADNKENNKEQRIAKKIEKIKLNFKDENFCKLILLKDNELIGFISIFPNDCDECRDLTPWYSTIQI